MINDIAGDIVTLKKLKKLRKNIESFRNRISNIRCKELEQLAKSLGRKRINRGGELTYESELLPNSRVLTIPKHPGALNKYTAGNILDHLEQDIFELEENLEAINHG